jgi:hypothetical protein
MTDFYALLRSLTFGGILGAGAGATIAVLVPQLGVDLRAGAFIGLTIGTAVHRQIDRITSGFLGATFVYYAKVIQIRIWGDRFGARFQRELLEELTRDYVLGPRRSGRAAQSLPEPSEPEN